MIPYLEIWFGFEYDVKDLLYVHIGRKRKLTVTTLLTGLNNDETAKNRETNIVTP